MPDRPEGVLSVTNESPRSHYVAPVYIFKSDGKSRDNVRIKVGERLTTRLPSDVFKERYYTSQGFKLASEEDVDRFQRYKGWTIWDDESRNKPFNMDIDEVLDHSGGHEVPLEEAPLVTGTTRKKK